MKYLYSLLIAFTFFASVPAVHADEAVTIFLFGRDDCAHCTAEKVFLDNYIQEELDVRFEYLNVLEDVHAGELFSTLTEKHGLSKVTPLTIIGAEAIQGFDTEETTGTTFMEAVIRARTSDIHTIEDHLNRAPSQKAQKVGKGCDENGTECDSTTNPNAYMFRLPFVGVADFKDFSLFSLSAVLGTIDGFNPCAMWVLITFLVLLSQIGDKRKMILVASIFILAETIMYNLILNVWFTTWDFVGLDMIVTPFVGFLAIGGGVYFLHQYHKNKHAPLACDVSDLESQSKTTQKIQELITQPTTLLTILGIIAVAFSVNIIEFACSIGIPQAFTKILEMNDLSFVTRQWYILVYMAGYMIDDLIVFALAIWGFSRLESHGHKYAQISHLIGGILMLILGLLLLFEPSFLVL